jgi:hypothetical protein
MNRIAELTLSAMGHTIRDLPHYQSALSQGCELHPPPFGEAWYSNRFREMACDAGWVVQCLIANAKKEGDGARTLWSLAGAISEQTIARQVSQHAVDESRHARVYITMIELTFPGALDPSVAASLQDVAPSYHANDAPPASPARERLVVVDEIIQMNIGEIRTRINQLLLRPVLCAWAPEEAIPRLHKALERLMVDETRHIEYTARLIEAAASEGLSDFVHEAMSKRIADFNEYTLTDVGPRPSVEA